MPEALIVIAYLTVRAGKRLEFEEFERQALSLVRQHGGELLHALEPIATSPSTDPPDEVHILRFPSQRALHDYRADTKLLHRHAPSLASSDSSLPGITRATVNGGSLHMTSPGKSGKSWHRRVSLTYP